MNATATAEAIDFAPYKNKMVDLTYQVRVEGEVRQITEQGRVIDGNRLGLIFKRRSQRAQGLIEAEDVLDISDVQTARLQAIGKKHLKTVTAASVRRHLVDFHGMKLSAIEGLGPEAAMRLHDGIDHADLGHDHDADASTTSAPKSSDAEKDDILSKISNLRRTA